MRFRIVLLFAVLGCASQASAASPEQSYIAARDSYMAKFKPYTDHTPNGVLKDEERARQDLARRLRRALGPPGVKGFSAAGVLNQPTLLPGGDDAEAIDGLVFKSDDGATQLLVTTSALVASWLRQHREMLVDNALEYGSKDPIKKTLFEKPSRSRDAKIEAWLARHREVTQDVAGMITSELFYSQMFDFGSAAVKYAEIAVSTPPQASSVYAVLVGRQQDIGPYPPQELIVTVAQGSRIYVLATKPDVAIEMIPACDAIWQAVVKQRDEAYDTKWAAKAKDGAVADKPVAIENAGDKAFHRCFAERAKTAGFYPALRRQAQGLVDRVEGK
jgi:hypothetical protein